MPELPEVETIKKALETELTDKTIKRIILKRKDLRFPIPDDFINISENQHIKSVTRRGKYILIALTNNHSIILHLGMSGRITILPAPELYKEPNKEQKHDHMIMTLNNGANIIFNDPRRFGMLLLLRPEESLQTHPLFKKMGPEPLGNHFSGPILEERLTGKKASIKTALLDQRIVCGIGNIYACEALFESGIHPETMAGSIKGEKAAALYQALCNALNKAIEAGGSSLKDYAHTDGSLGYFQTQFKVYDRENVPCQLCQTPIKRYTQSGRSTFYCPHCQNPSQ